MRSFPASCFRNEIPGVFGRDRRKEVEEKCEFLRKLFGGMVSKAGSGWTWPFCGIGNSEVACDNKNDLGANSVCSQ